MIIQIINETEKIITADDGKVLTNGGEFEQYPIELVCNINDNSWYEIDKPIDNFNSETENSDNNIIF